MESVSRRMATAFERVPPLYYKQAFFLSVLAYVVLMMWDAQTYGPTVRLFPVLIGVPLIGLLLVQLAYPALPGWLEFRANGLTEQMTSGSGIDTGESVDRAVRIRREAGMVGWTILALATTYLFGFLATLTLFVFTFVYYYERSVVLTFTITGLTVVLSYTLFVIVLQVRLFPGVIW